MRRARLLAAVAAATFASGCRCGGPPTTGKGAPRPVAVVNGEPIAAETLARELEHAREGGAEGATGVMMVARRAALRRPFAEARPEIEERLLREKRARAQDEYLAAVRARAKIDVDEKALEAVSP
jgi:hypothetical protein